MTEKGTEALDTTEGKHATLAEAFTEAQAEFPPVDRDGVNPHFKSKFTTLGHLLGKVRPVLNKHGLSVIQLPCRGEDGEPVLRTMILHESGQEITADAPLLLSKRDPQGQGSAITYMRRYALAAALGISDQDDDDGNAGSGEAHNTAAPPKGAASDRACEFLTSQLQKQKLTAPEKALVNGWLKGSAKVWQKQTVSAALDWIKEGQIAQLLQAAGATESDLPAPDVDGLEPVVTDGESGVTF